MEKNEKISLEELKKDGWIVATHYSPSVLVLIRGKKRLLLDKNQKRL